MSKTQRFRDQHAELVGIVGEISAFLEPAKAQAGAEAIRSLLAQLSGKLVIHLAMEDESLYPRLVQSSDGKLKDLATRYSTEMGSIKAEFVKYKDRWSTAAAIQRDAAGFVRETKAIFAVLAKRVEKENGELYPMADQAA